MMKTENIITRQPIIVTKDFRNKNIVYIYNKENFVIKIPDRTCNITIENISGDKNVYQNDIKQKTSPIKKEIQHRKEAIDKPTIQIDKIENNGNLSVGQTGGTINQTTIVTLKPIPRHLTETETKSIRNSIPLGYSVDVNYPMSNKESENFAFEMLNMLSQSGYKITRSIYGQIVPDLEQSFYINLNPSDSTAEITIYRLK